MTGEFALQLLSPCELANASLLGLSYLWHGYLAPGKVTALVAAPKSGKTTLTARLLARLANGGTLAGLAVTPGRAIVLSEEAPADWDARCRALGIGPNVQFFCRPFLGARPTEAQWFAMIASLESLNQQQGFDLIVIDSLAALLPGYAETCGPKMMDCLAPLQRLAGGGVAVLLLHHPAKAKRADGQSSRGAGTLLGFADIIMEMSCYRRARSADRRRRICAYSRYDETPRHLVIEWNADGSDYTVQDAHAPRPTQSWPRVMEILNEVYRKLDEQEILDHWPSEEEPPDRSTLSRLLNRAVKQGAILRSGAGHKGHAYLYWLPGREALLFPGYDAGAEAIEVWKEKCGAETHEKLMRQLGLK